MTIFGQKMAIFQGGGGAASPICPCSGRLLLPCPAIIALGFWPTRAPRCLVPVLFCVPSLIPCLYPTGPPATKWRGPEGLFRAPSTDCSYSFPCFRAHLFFFRSFFPLCAPRWPFPPPDPLCVPSAVPGPVVVFWLSGLVFLLVFLPSSLHAHTILLHLTSVVAAPLRSFLWSSRPCLALPVAVAGHAS